MTKDYQLTKDYRRPGYRAVTAGLSVNGSAALLDFLKRAFDARDGDINWNADRSIGHGEILIGDSLIEMSEARPEWPAKPCSVHHYVRDADACYAKAVEAGAISINKPENAPYGDRAAAVRDPAGQSVVHRHAPRGRAHSRGLSLDYAVRDHIGR